MEMLLYTLIEYLRAPLVQGVISILGFGATLFGLALAYMQAKRARSASEAARDTAEALRERFEVVATGYAEGMIIAFISSVKAEKFDLADWQFSTIKRAARIHLGAMNDLQGVEKCISSINKHMCYAMAGDDRYRYSILHKAADGLAQRFSLRQQVSLDMEG